MITIIGIAILGLIYEVYFYKPETNANFLQVFLYTVKLLFMTLVYAFAGLVISAVFPVETVSKKVLTTEISNVYLYQKVPSDKISDKQLIYLFHEIDSTNNIKFVQSTMGNTTVISTNDKSYLEKYETFPTKSFKNLFSTYTKRTTYKLYLNQSENSIKFIN